MPARTSVSDTYWQYAMTYIDLLQPVSTQGTVLRLSFSIFSEPGVSALVPLSCSLLFHSLSLFALLLMS